MLPITGKISLYDIFMETPSIKPINMKDYIDYYNLSGKVGINEFYGKEERLIKEVLIYKNQNNLQFQLTNRKPQTPEMIFNNWGRIKGNLFYANKTEADLAGDAEATAWYFENNQIYMPLNVEPINGFVSNMEFDNYTFECTITSSHADNDSIGLIAAFHRENNNNYYLCFYANMSGTLPYTGIGISYQGADATHTTWDNGSNLLYTGGNFGDSSASAGHGWSNKTRRLKIQRDGDIFNFWFSEIDSEILSTSPQFTIDINSDPRLLKFRGKKKYGYMTNSQPYSTYKNINFINVGLDENIIIDYSNKKVYRFDNPSNSWKITTESIQNTLGYDMHILNPEGKEYGEDYWYKVTQDNIEYMGKYYLNTNPTIEKIKSKQQFLNINELDYNLVNTSELTNLISAFQRRNYFNMPEIFDIPISNFTNREINLTSENYNKLNITNLEKTSLVLSNGKVLGMKYKTLNTLEIYNPKSWYLLNLSLNSDISGSLSISSINTILAKDDYFYIVYFKNSIAYFAKTEDFESFEEIVINPTPTKDSWMYMYEANDSISLSSFKHDSDYFSQYLNTNLTINKNITATMPKHSSEFQDKTSGICYFKNNYYLFNTKGSYFSGPTLDTMVRRTPFVYSPNFIGDSSLAYDVTKCANNATCLIVEIGVHHINSVPTFQRRLYRTTDSNTWTGVFTYPNTYGRNSALFYSSKYNRFTYTCISDDAQPLIRIYKSTDGINWVLHKSFSYLNNTSRNIIFNKEEEKIFFVQSFSSSQSFDLDILDENGIQQTDIVTKLMNYYKPTNTFSPTMVLSNSKLFVEYQRKFMLLNLDA